MDIMKLNNYEGENLNGTAVAGKEQVAVAENSVVGKKYTFVSTRGNNIVGLLDSKVTNKVEIGEDRLFIETKPKRFNKAPAVLFEDITGIEIKKNINFYYWFWIVISAIIGFMGVFYMFLCTLVFLFCGLQNKITISQRNGIKVVIYAGSKVVAEAFKEDMKTVTNIH